MFFRDDYFRRAPLLSDNDTLSLADHMELTETEDNETELDVLDTAPRTSASSPHSMGHSESSTEMVVGPSSALDALAGTRPQTPDIAGTDFVPPQTNPSPAVLSSYLPTPTKYPQTYLAPPRPVPPPSFPLRFSIAPLIPSLAEERHPPHRAPSPPQNLPTPTLSSLAAGAHPPTQERVLSWETHGPQLNYQSNASAATLSHDSEVQQRLPTLTDYFSTAPLISQQQPLLPQYTTDNYSPSVPDPVRRQYPIWMYVVLWVIFMFITSAWDDGTVPRLLSA